MPTLQATVVSLPHFLIEVDSQIYLSYVLGIWNGSFECLLC